MKFAFIVYDGLTLLDFAGVYDPVTRLKNMGFMEELEYDVCAFKETVRSFEGLTVVADKVKNDLKVYDYIFVPGGNGIINLLRDQAFLNWIKDISPEAVMTSVCGGSLLLGAAGLLKNKEATTHPAFMHHLGNFTDKVTDKRVVDDGNLITARGVTSAIDLGLYLSEKIAGPEVREKIQRQMDYRAYPI